MIQENVSIVRVAEVLIWWRWIVWQYIAISIAKSCKPKLLFLQGFFTFPKAPCISPWCPITTSSHHLHLWESSEKQLWKLFSLIFLSTQQSLTFPPETRNRTLHKVITGILTTWNEFPFSSNRVHIAQFNSGHLKAQMLVRKAKPKHFLKGTLFCTVSHPKFGSRWYFVHKKRAHNTRKKEHPGLTSFGKKDLNLAAC